MSIAASKGVLMAHAQRYIRSLMADRLRQEGFVSKDGDDIHWYRVVNGEVVHAVYFYTRYARIPMYLDIGYGCHPLFISPVFTKGPYMYGMPAFEVIYPRYQLLKDHNMYAYAEDILVTCPADEYHGADYLDRVLLALQSAQTPLDCYQIHKEWRAGAIANNSWLSTQFVDEVVYWNDEALYPVCAGYICDRTAVLENAQRNEKLWSGSKQELEQLRIVKKAVIDGEREAHLALLEERKIKTIRQLNKHTGIRI